MLFYITMTLTLLLLLGQYVWFKRAERHDKHLFRLCQVRREAMHFLMDEHQHLPKKEALALRENIDVLNTLIGRYATHKTRLFNFRLFMARVQEMKRFERKQKNADIENAKVIELRHKTMAVVFGAFWDYTPFLRHELVVRLCVALISAATKAGVQSLSGLLRELQQLRETISYSKQPQYSYNA